MGSNNVRNVRARGSRQRYNFGEPEEYRRKRELRAQRLAFLGALHRLKPAILEELWQEVMPVWSRTSYYHGINSPNFGPADESAQVFLDAFDGWGTRHGLRMPHVPWLLHESCFLMRLWSSLQLDAARVREMGWEDLSTVGWLDPGTPPFPAPGWDIRCESEAAFRARVDRYIKEVMCWAEKSGGRLKAPKAESRFQFERLARLILGESPEDIAKSEGLQLAPGTIWRSAKRLAKNIGVPMPPKRRGRPPRGAKIRTSR